jgi:predicted NAD-dependent protein-ADP-ribosyltransferase YbiA (DUF1768 family)
MSDAFDLSEALGQYEGATDFVNKAKAADALADAVRTYIEDNEPNALNDSPPRRLSRSAPLSFSTGAYFSNGTNAGTGITAIQTGLNIWHSRTVSYDGETYPTAFNAFQAQKEAVKEQRKPFTTCSWSEAASLGCHCSIDVKAWDAGREDLITDILTEQAKQHQDFAKLIIKYAGKVVENSMGDKWWIDTMPNIWKAVKEAIVDQFPFLVTDGDAHEDDEVVEEDDEGEEEAEGEAEEEEVQVKLQKKLKRVPKGASSADRGSFHKSKKLKRAMA